MVQVEENLERWRFTSERGGVKRSKVVRQIASVCEGEGEARGMIELQGAEVAKGRCI